MSQVILSDTIFKNASKGDKASAAELAEAFGEEKNPLGVILEKGDVQLSAAERKDAVDKKRKEIVSYLHKYYTDPVQKKPHPIQRLELALDEAKYRVDPDIPADRQVQDVLKKFIGVLPMKKSEITGTLRIPVALAGAAQGVVMKLADVSKESWDADSCIFDISVVPGSYDTLMAEINKVTKGSFEFNVDGAAAAAAAATSEDSVSDKKGKKKK